MKYIQITEPGTADVLVLQAGDAPAPGPGQVLLKVAAAGVNRPDVFQRLGKYPPPPGASAIPGLEVAGTVVDHGAGVDTPEIGAQVCALLTGGGYAEYAVAEAPLCLPVPAGLKMTEAAAIPETFYTVWSNVFDRGRLLSGETLLVHGGSSGIGTTAIQLGKAFGAQVFVTAGSAQKCAACVGLGADVAINYKTEDFVERCRDATGGRGVDVVLDMVAGDYIARNIEIAAIAGRIVIIAGLRGYRAAVDFLPLMRKRLTITGSTLRARDVAFKAGIARALEDKVWPLLAAGTVKPVIFRVLAMADAAEAHRIMESSAHTGKIVLSVDARGPV